MKKIIIATLVWSALLTSATFADEYTKPMLLNEPMNIDSENITKSLWEKYDIIIRNNFLESDYEYNNKTYYTSKIKAENIIIPEEIKEKAKKIYFLVEEWNSRVYDTYDYASSENMKIEDVKNVYNYKIVEYKEWQKEYILKNSDLVKDFWKDEYKTVTITLMADISESEKIPLSTSAYNYINIKQDILNQLLVEAKWDDYYYWYFNSDILEKYLTSIWDKTNRTEYKKILNKMVTKISTAKKQNTQLLKDTLENIKVENDFKSNLDKYEMINESKNLLDNLNMAVKNQIQNIKAFEAVDLLLK